MNLLEWQAKRLLAEAGVPVPRGQVARTPEEARAIAAGLGGAAMVKAQVPGGGRGKAGGVRRASDAEAAARVSQDLLGQPLLGHRVAAVLVEEAIDAARELYLALSVDFRVRRTLLLVSADGGVEVEALAAKRLGRVELDPLLGWRDYLARQALAAARVSAAAWPALITLGRALYGQFVACDATLVEVNPLLLREDGSLVAADARVVLDDAALARRPALADFGPDPGDADATARIKRAFGFDYVELDPQGDIGLIGTGAGGTMLTVDLIARAGGRPINFVDVRTGMIGRDPTRLIAVLDELRSRPNLRVILVSVFGAITDLAELAAALIEALRASPPDVPVHVRFQGRNEEPARALLRANGLTCHPTLEAAIAAVVAPPR